CVHAAQAVAEALSGRRGPAANVKTAQLTAYYAEVAATAEQNVKRNLAEGGEQARLARDLFGNPFRPVAVDPAWRTPAVQAIARAAYEERLLPAGTLDPVRLAVLADALVESGCQEASILEHLRGPGPHVRGCFAVDALLGKS